MVILIDKSDTLKAHMAQAVLPSQDNPQDNEKPRDEPDDKDSI